MTTNESDPALAISKESANVWWSANLGRPVPAFVPPEAYFQPHQPDPANVALPVILALLGLIFTPFAWAAWPIASHELKRFRADRQASLSFAPIRGEGWLVFARGFAAVLTVVPLIVIAIAIAAGRFS